MSEHSTESVVKQSLSSLLEEIENSIEFEIEEVKYDISDLIFQIMEDKGISRAQLAESMHRSRPFITKLLSGTNNFEVSTLVHIARALKCKINIKNLFLSDNATVESGVNPWIIMNHGLGRSNLRLAYSQRKNITCSNELGSDGALIEWEEDLRAA